MTDSKITVSDGTNFFRITLSDLEEACADGFYVPALRGRAIVSDGQQLFEIPATDVADAQADGFQDILTAEADLVESLRSSVSAAETANSFETFTADIPEVTPSVVIVQTVTAPIAVKPTAARQKTKKGVETPQVPLASTEAAPEEPTTFAARLRRMLPSFQVQKRHLTVLAMNAAIQSLFVLLMATLFLPNEYKEEILTIISTFESEGPANTDQPIMELEQPVEPMEMSDSTPLTEVFVDSNVASFDTSSVEIGDLALGSIATNVTANGTGAIGMPSGEFGGRSKAGRQAMVARMGGTAGSEMAVQTGLEWIKRHQAEDGGWSFDHTAGECKGSCSQPGSLQSNCRNAATGMAILAMLGAGNTPFEGEFQETVLRGVKFLLANSNAVPAGLDLRGQHSTNTGMYTHAIATTALCETLAMLRFEVKAAKGQEDPGSNKKQRAQIIRQLEPVAAAAVNFIVNAQHPDNGSWGYNPGTSGDTSILGWQVMALKSAAHAEIPFNANAIIGANTFLNTVQAEDGSYGYSSNNPTQPSTTAIGLVCRMLSGMPRSEPRLQAAVARLSAIGPVRGNMYYNYYATQVMLNYGGDTWTKWNQAMRDQLVSTQIKEGHAAGSWDVSDTHGGVAGRLYMTCLCTMTLEVYYRHLPLYGMPEEADVAAAKESGPDK